PPELLAGVGRPPGDALGTGDALPVAEEPLPGLERADVELHRRAQARAMHLAEAALAEHDHLARNPVRSGKEVEVRVVLVPPGVAGDGDAPGVPEEVVQVAPSISCGASALWNSS